jgi:hypothetical protein
MAIFQVVMKTTVHGVVEAPEEGRPRPERPGIFAEWVEVQVVNHITRHVCDKLLSALVSCPPANNCSTHQRRRGFQQEPSRELLLVHIPGLQLLQDVLGVEFAGERSVRSSHVVLLVARQKSLVDFVRGASKTIIQLRRRGGRRSFPADVVKIKR